MSKYVHIATPTFETAAKTRGQLDLVISETRKGLQDLRGLGVDLVVMCEGVEAYAQTLDTAEEMDAPGPMLSMYQEEAVALNSHIAASVKIREGGRVHNSQVFISPSGDFLGVYHKCNLTIPELEKGLSPGTKAVTIDTEVGRLGGIICFDLNFRWLLDQYIVQKPDILCFSSMYHGSAMVQGMWAYECRSFFASGLPIYEGGTLNPHGEMLDRTHRSNRCSHARVNLDRVLLHCDYNGVKFQDIRRTYGAEVRIDVPAHTGTAILYSESEKRSAMDICQEFDLEQLDRYFERSLHANADGRASAAPLKGESNV
ncbi:carbon-nitrogen hydrolase family protein [Kiritimatiellaeota bacterium B1221]|nr:carbon-nitrogen hydrolase family protein [Kiritimatiellaeota bacterium B1221]